MNVTVLYSDGSSETFSSVTYTDITGDVLTIEGTDMGGVSGTFRIRWSTVKKVTSTGG